MTWSRRSLMVLLVSLVGFMMLPMASHALDLEKQIFDQTQKAGKDTFQTDIDPKTGAQQVVGNAVNFVVGILGVIAVILMIYAGFLWMTAGGNDDQIKKAKQTISRVVVGILIVFIAYAVVVFIVAQIQQPEKKKSMIPMSKTLVHVR